MRADVPVRGRRSEAGQGPGLGVQAKTVRAPGRVDLRDRARPPVEGASSLQALQDRRRQADITAKGRVLRVVEQVVIADSDRAQCARHGWAVDQDTVVAGGDLSVRLLER